MPDIYADHGKASLEKVLQGLETREQNELTIEFLQELIRQALADFVAVQYPLLDYRQALRLMQTVVSIRTPILSVDTLALADELMRISGDRRAALKKEISARLVSCVERVLAGFLHFLEKTAKGTSMLSSEKVLTDAQLDLEILDRYSEAKDMLNTSMNLGELSSREIKVPLEGKAWRVNLTGYSGEQLKPFSKKDKMLVALKKKQAFLQNRIKPRLEYMVRVIKKQGPASPLTMELRPFLKGAFDKTKFVEALARNTFSRMAGTDLTENSANGLLQTLDLEMQALERYLLKLERIFRKLEKENVPAGELPRTKAMRLTPDDETLLSDKSGKIKIEEQLSGLAKELQLPKGLAQDDTVWFDPRHKNNGIDWSVKKRTKQPAVLEGGSARITTKKIVDVPQTGTEKKAGVFARLFGALLDPGKKFKAQDSRISSATTGLRTASRSSRERPGVDILLPAAPEGSTARNIRKRRGVYHHGLMF